MATLGGKPTLQPFISERRELGLYGSEPRQHFTRSLDEGAQEHIEPGTPEYGPLA